MYSFVWPGRKRIFFLQVNLQVWFNRHRIISMSCPVLQEYCVICAATLLKGKSVNSNSYGSSPISWNLMKEEKFWWFPWEFFLWLKFLQHFLFSAFVILSLKYVFLILTGLLMKSHGNIGCYALALGVNRTFNILGKLGLGTRVQDIFTCKHLYPPWLLGVT